MAEVDVWRGFYGTQRVEAKPIRGGYEGQPDQDGYEVRYKNGCQMSFPKEAFESSYQSEDHMDFSRALLAMKDGYTVCLSTWLETEGLVLVEGLLLYKVSRARVHSLPVGWILATDWRIVGK